MCVIDRVDRYVECSRDLRSRQVCRQMPQYAELARAELFRRRQIPISARRRCATQQVDDIGEQRAVCSLVTWKGVEQLGGVVHGKREDQPIRFSSSERGLGG